MTEWDYSIWHSPNSNLTLKYLWKRLMTFASHVDPWVPLHAVLRNKEDDLRVTLPYSRHILFHPTLSSAFCPISPFLASKSPHKPESFYSVFTISDYDLPKHVPWATLLTIWSCLCPHTGLLGRFHAFCHRALVHAAPLPGLPPLHTLWLQSMVI